MRRMVSFALLLSLAACAGSAGSPTSAATAPAPTKNYVVFFQTWSAALDNAALSTIETAATTANQNPSLPVTVIGYADPTGGRQANLFMSATRAQVVIDQLAADGVARTRIHRHAAGIVGYKLTTQESRRAVIALGGS